eukprot:gb/GFBE01043272.1/.p1 GENE.gb/GFBE01043272.1/~~gb/GFBE01043272.1/.p1  ORF type:complete len:605 (+),score=123.24 gb/GFBE01043272.1/:1-1815(+)
MAAWQLISWALLGGCAASTSRSTSPAAFATPSLQEGGCCRFSRAFHGVDWRDRETQLRYITEAVAAERSFFAAPNVSYDEVTGMTYDGHALDPTTGELKRGPPPAGPFTFSAASKESIHISLLALALRPFTDGEEAPPLVYTRKEALDVLERKVASMEAFDQAQPGFGGFLPWFCARGASGENHEPGASYSCRSLEEAPGPIVPTSDWVGKVPGLDNGQLAWATYAVANVLMREAKDSDAEDSGRVLALALRWAERLQRMRETAVPLFYAGAGTGAVRAVTTIRNTSQEAWATNNTATGGEAYPPFLDDVYEGELMVLFMDLLAEWKGYPQDGAAEKEKMWARKQLKVIARNYTAQDGSVLTVQEGFWFSSHEQWKLMVLPYLQIPLVKQIFTNSEYVRVLNAVENNVPGIFASSHAPPTVMCGHLGGYCNAVGVQAVASQTVQWDQSVSPYGAYPVILVDPGAGLAWYNTMLSLPHMQTEAGSVESSDVAGTSVAPVLTWDTKTTTVLAMLGGTGTLIGEFMQEDGLFERFEVTVGGMYAAAFVGKLAPPIVDASTGHLPMPPPHVLPQHWADAGSAFPTCGCNASSVTSAIGGRRLNAALFV